MANEKIIAQDVFEKSIKDILQIIADNVYNLVPYDSTEISEILEISDEEAMELVKIINDNVIANNKLWSSSKTNNEIQNAIIEANKYADELIGQISSISLEYVTVLPTSDIKSNVIYILQGTPNTLNVYNTSTNAFVTVGDLDLDLSQYYTKSDVDTLLADKADNNNVVHQEDIVSNLTTTSGTTTLSTAGLQTELDKKANDDEVVKTADITTTIDSASTDTKVPTAKAVEKRIKNMLVCPNDKSPKEFALENCKSGQVVEFVQWGGSHVDSVGVYATYRMIRGTDPNWAVLVATIYDTDYRRTIKYCPYDGYREDAIKWKKWQRVVTTTVEDVPLTSVTIPDGLFQSVNNVSYIKYEIVNGIAFLYFNIRDAKFVKSGTSLNMTVPKIKNPFNHTIIGENFNTNLTILADGTNMQLWTLGDETMVTNYSACISYPVAES